MPHEILGELIVLGIEAGVEIASKDKKGSGCSCFLFLSVIIIIGLIIGYLCFGLE